MNWYTTTILTSLVLCNVAMAEEQVLDSDNCHSQRLSNHYWSKEANACLPCTNCRDQRLIPLMGCAPNKDAICGTIEDLR